MIRQLRRKFITTTLLLVVAVLFLAFCCVFFFEARNLEAESETLLRQLSEESDSSNLLGSFFFSDKSTQKGDALLNVYDRLRPAFILYVYDDTHTYQVSGYASSAEPRDSYLNGIIRDVTASGAETGTLKQQNLRFRCSEQTGGRKIVLLDKSYEDDSLRTLLLTLFGAWCVSLLLILSVSILITRIALKPTERSLQQQKQFISDISHELKTPISIIDASTDIVRSHPDDSVQQQEKWLGYLRTETGRMLTLISDLLTLARTEESDSSGACAPLNLSDLSYSIVLPMESICFEEGRQLQIDIQDGLFVRADESAMRQLVSILLDNACKYSGVGGHITFTLRAESDRVVICVQNTGDVIPPNQLPHIFDRFFRVANASSQNAGGHGLGLAIAKKLTEENRGKITAESNETDGTTLRCVFKRSRAPKMQKKKQARTNS